MEIASQRKGKRKLSEQALTVEAGWAAIAADEVADVVSAAVAGGVVYRSCALPRTRLERPFALLLTLSLLAHRGRYQLLDCLRSIVTHVCPCTCHTCASALYELRVTSTRQHFTL